MNGRDTPLETRGVCEAPSDKQHANTARPAQPIYCERKRSYRRSALGIDKEEQLITQAAQKARSKKYEHKSKTTTSSNTVQAHPAQFMKGRPERRRQFVAFSKRMFPPTQ